jgi:hypothetical protein
VLECSRAASALAAGAALVGGSVIAAVLYEITHRLIFDRRRAQALATWNMDYPLEYRRGLWFWHPRR